MSSLSSSSSSSSSPCSTSCCCFSTANIPPSAKTSSSSNISYYTIVPPATSPLPSHTFAGMVEQAMMEKFFPKIESLDDQKQIKRILESWRLLEQGYEHDEHVGVTVFHRDSTASNCKQFCHSYVPGLTVQEFWDTSDKRLFANRDKNTRQKNWCQFLESKFSSILREFKQATSDMNQLRAQGNNIWASAHSQDANSYGKGWKTLVLMDRGRWDPVNVNLFPTTSKAIRDSGLPAVEVFFASMQPHSSIHRHSDFTNFVLTSHLALDIPYSGSNKCRITVGDETREWINGQVMIMDTSLLHDAVNESDKTRYILMFRLWHPDLSPIERDAMQFIYDCLDIPELVSADPKQRIRAQELATQLHSFPQIIKGTATKQGFTGKHSISNGRSSDSGNGRTRKSKK